MVDVLKKKVPGVCGQALNSVARNCETDHKKAAFDIIQIVHKLQGDNSAPFHSQEKLINGEHEQVRHYLRGSVVLHATLALKILDFMDVRFGTSVS